MIYSHPCLTASLTLHTNLEPTEGFEPTTRCLQNSRSDQLSYVGNVLIIVHLSDIVLCAPSVVLVSHTSKLDATLRSSYAEPTTLGYKTDALTTELR